ATTRAMREIRRVIPSARLIQTEDFGHTFSTQPCAAQAGHDNIRRLATWDLLTGRMTGAHPFRGRLDGFGLGKRVEALNDDPTPPDVIGLNHYVTSDRFLDHRLDLYPPHVHGGNGEMAYADVEAVRVVQCFPCGWSAALHTLWERYG